MIYEGYWKNGKMTQGIIINQKEKTIYLGEVHPHKIPLRKGKGTILNLDDYSTKLKAEYSEDEYVKGSLQFY